jgi:AcrR family transcriptional regulator
VRGYAKGRARRREILRAADELFSTHGFRGASLNQIAAAAGITDAGLLHHFPSKEHLLIELLQQRDEEDVGRVTAEVDQHETLPEALVHLCERNAATPGLVRLFTVMAAESIESDHPAHEYFRDRYRELRVETVEQLRRAQAAGDIDGSLDPDLLARQLLAMFDGLQLQWLLEPDEVDMVEAMRDYLARLGP